MGDSCSGLWRGLSRRVPYIDIVRMVHCGEFLEPATDVCVFVCARVRPSVCRDGLEKSSCMTSRARWARWCRLLCSGAPMDRGGP